MGKVRTWYLGSLNNSRSYISALWRAIPIIAKERKHGLFILQDLQNKEPKACGNNRQRGKIALAIFCELGYVHEVETKGVSTKYALGRNKPFDRTLDDIFSELTHDRSAQEINDPEQFYDVETEELEQRPKNWNKDSEFVT
jgi:hypothetical protein